MLSVVWKIKLVHLALRNSFSSQDENENDDEFECTQQCELAVGMTNWKFFLADVEKMT
jgi:hypothetical protein